MSVFVKIGGEFKPFTLPKRLQCRRLRALGPIQGRLCCSAGECSAGEMTEQPHLPPSLARERGAGLAWGGTTDCPRKATHQEEPAKLKLAPSGDKGSGQPVTPSPSSAVSWVFMRQHQSHKTMSSSAI